MIGEVSFAVDNSFFCVEKVNFWLGFKYAALFFIVTFKSFIFNKLQNHYCFMVNLWNFSVKKIELFEKNDRTFW